MKTPKTPPCGAWKLAGRVQAGVVYDNHETGIRVVSSVDSVERNPPGSGLHTPHFHVSATKWVAPFQAPIICTDQDMEPTRRDFGMGGAEEDNHGKGAARHLWLECSRDVEPECPCKQDEERTVEGQRVRYDAKEGRS